MEERRRAPRVLTDNSVTEDHFLDIANGTILNISECGIKYSQRAELYPNLEATKPPDIRTLYFSLPGHDTYMRLTCSVVTEEINGIHIETSGDFICLSKDDRLAIREYVNNSLF